MERKLFYTWKTRATHVVSSAERTSAPRQLRIFLAAFNRKHKQRHFLQVREQCILQFSADTVNNEGLPRREVACVARVMADWGWILVLMVGTNSRSENPIYQTSKSCYTVIRFLWVSAKFGTCTVVSANGTPVEAKLCTFTLESTHFVFNLCPIYTHDSASAKFSTNSQETDYSVGLGVSWVWSFAMLSI